MSRLRPSRQVRLEEIALTYADGGMTREQYIAANRRITERLTTNRERPASAGGTEDLA